MIVMNHNKANKLNLNRNEYFFNHPSEVIFALTSPYEENFISHYAQPYELEKLKKAISDIYNVDKNFVLLGHGAEDIFVKILSWFRKEINSIVIEDFSWTNYLHIAEGFNYAVSIIPTLELNNTFSFNKEGFYEKLSHLKSSIVFITTPNNPTGHSANLTDIYSLAQYFPEHIFILDSVYNEIIDPYYSSLFTLKNIIFIGSFSKFFGMPGLRLCYSICSLPKAFQLNLGLQPTTIYAALAALNNFNIYQSNRNFMLEFSKKLSSKNYRNLKIYESCAPFFLSKVINSKGINFQEIEEKSGVVPKYINRNEDIYLRFGLGPEEVCSKIELYLNLITLK